MDKKDAVRVWDFLEPLEGNLIVTEPESVGKRNEVVRESGLIEIATNDVVAATYGVVCRVLKVHPDLEEQFPVGSSLLIHEHGGQPIWSGNDSKRGYIISEGDVMAKVSDKYWDYYGNEED